MARSGNIILRVSKAEKALIEENARAAGRTVSEYLRTMALLGTPDLRPSAGPKAKRPQRAGDFEGRVEELARTMPRRNAEVLARRELRL